MFSPACWQGDIRAVNQPGVEHLEQRRLCGAVGARITVITWNVGTAMPPSDVTSLLHLNTGESSDTDLIVIG
uniref:Uncharacterized protein n=1 Tax=Varanus komodoensis TaxID=61221 RepID=A0A8D2KVZ6_VARKO